MAQCFTLALYQRLLANKCLLSHECKGECVRNPKRIRLILRGRWRKLARNVSVVQAAPPEFDVHGIRGWDKPDENGSHRVIEPGSCGEAARLSGGSTKIRALSIRRAAPIAPPDAGSECQDEPVGFAGPRAFKNRGRFGGATDTGSHVAGDQRGDR